MDNEDKQQTITFAATNGDYYHARFEELRSGRRKFAINLAALAGGPLWAAARGMTAAAWLLTFLHAAALMMFAAGLASEDVATTAGVLLSPLSALGFSMVADMLYLRHFGKWRTNPGVLSGFSTGRMLWMAAGVLTFLPLLIYRAGRDAPGARECLRMWRRVSKGEDATTAERFDCLILSDAPNAKAASRAVAEGIDGGVDFLTINFSAFFDAITAIIHRILNGLEAVFVGTPWPLTVLALLLIAYYAAGRAVAVFMAAALFYIAFFGFWNEAMSTLSLVGAASFLCVITGVPLGIWSAKSKGAYRIVRPVLDVMQTVPSFVYLIPAIAFFSIGKPPAILATVIFAMPPMIRLTTLGIMQAPFSVCEAAVAFGATPRQLLFKVELPLAMPSIMAGITQTIMLALSMVVIAALIGAGGLGYDVLFSLQNVEPGRGILAGIAIALCAMMIDRIAQGKRKA